MKFFRSDQWKLAALITIGEKNGIVTLGSDSIVGVVKVFSPRRRDCYSGNAFDFLDGIR